MRTTIDLPDELFRQAKARAALSGVSLKQLLTYWIERGLTEADSPPAAQRTRRETPSIITPRGRRIPVLSNAEIETMLASEEVGDALGPQA